jgi:hypothetical protein
LSLLARGLDSSARPPDSPGGITSQASKCKEEEVKDAWER